MKELENDLSTSITVIDKSLIVSLAGEMTDDNIDAINNLVIEKAHGANVNGAILNFSAVSVIDTYTYNEFCNMTKAISLMGVRVVWVGLRPGVVSALMDLNIEFDSNKAFTALNLEQGLAVLSKYDKNSINKGKI